MKLIKKIVSCSLVVSLTLAVAYANPIKTAKNKLETISNSLTTKQKVTAGISSLAGAAALTGIGIGVWNHCHSLPVVVIGGDKNARQSLIKKLRDPRTTFSYMGDKPLCEEIVSKTASGGEGIKGTGKTRAQFENWNITECDAYSPNAADMVKNARLVIAILTDDSSTYLINEWIKSSDCMIVSFVDEKYRPVIGVGNKKFDSLETLFDWVSDHNYNNGYGASVLVRQLATNCILVPENKIGQNNLLAHLSFYWNRHDDDSNDTFVRFEWCRSMKPNLNF